MRYAALIVTLLAGCYTTPDGRVILTPQEEALRRSNERRSREVDQLILEQQKANQRELDRIAERQRLARIEELGYLLVECRRQKQLVEDQLVALLDKQDRTGAELLLIDDLKEKRKELLGLETRLAVEETDLLAAEPEATGTI